MRQSYIRQISILSKRSIYNGNKSNPANKDIVEPQFDVEPVIGLEVHSRLNLKSKLFSRGGNSSVSVPNTQLDLLDLAIPGSLPKLNLAAVKTAVFTALGLNCAVRDVIHFDRKNYFYTDMPAGFQITQYNQPIAKDGFLDFIVTTYHHSLIAHSQPYDIVKYLYSNQRNSLQESEPYLKRSVIKQIQLEQDSAKTLSHLSADGRDLNSLVDYNRSGSSLIEIVFEPDLTSAHEASSLVRELIMILKTLEVCDCELQEGSLRVDANVSIKRINGSDIDNSVANRVELKNLNSIKALNRGIKAEIRRQTEEIVSGNKVTQESRTYDTKSDRTLLMRLKEQAIDYRYFPEPSIPPLQIDSKLIEKSREQLSYITLPGQKRERLRNKYNLDHVLIIELLAEPGLCEYYEEIIDEHESETVYDADTLADFLIYSITNLKQVGISPISIDLSKRDNEFFKLFTKEKMRMLFDMLFKEQITYTNALEVMNCLLLRSHATTPIEIVEELNLYSSCEANKIEAACRDIIKGMKNISKKYRRTGDKKYLRMMLDKLNELHEGRLSVRLAMEYFIKWRNDDISAKNKDSRIDL